MKRFNYKIEICAKLTDEDKFSFVPQVVYCVNVYINGELYYDHPNISSMEKAGEIALHYETFFKYYKQN